MEPPLPARRIKLGDTVLLRLPNGEVRGVKLQKNATVPLGRVGSFFSNELIDEPYGVLYEMVDKKLKPLPPRTIQELEDTDATNELINDGELVQPLTLQEIQELKQSGVHASDIIQKQIDLHANYSLKTEYSKEKYKKRKEAKYSKTFTAIEPTIMNVSDYWFKKDQTRIRDIRSDTLSQIITMAGIRPGGRYIIVDDASGIIVAAALERMGGEGRLITITDTESPPAYPVVVTMNFPDKIVAPVLSSLNWAAAEEDHDPILPPVEIAEGIRSDRQRKRIDKRKAAMDAFTNTRETLFAGEFDGMIIASDYDPLSILDRLERYVGGSAPIIFQSPHLQILSDLSGKMKEMPQFLCPTITEGWLRRYQVLPGRTHPTMSTSGSGGYILNVIKIYDDPYAERVLRPRHQRKSKAEARANAEAEVAATTKTEVDENMVDIKTET